MNWQKERDSLIAQTMAFVQSVAGNREEGDRLNGGFAAATTAQSSVLPELDLELRAARIVAPIEPVRIVEAPPATASPAPRAIVPGEMANEIRARVASFRAHQERFNREREQYFRATLARLRATLDDAKRPRVDK